MRIGRIQIVGFKNCILGPQSPKPVNRFYIHFRRTGISVNLWGYCIRIDWHKRPKFKTGKPISIEEFKAMMRAKGVDLSKATPVEISINGITEL